MLYRFVALVAITGSVLAEGPRALVQADEAEQLEAEQFFEKRIRPLLANRCWKCHSSRRVEAGLRLDSRSAVIKGGDSGPAVRPRDAGSLLLKAVRQTGDLKMPPDGRLAEAEIRALERWVTLGAPWPIKVATRRDQEGKSAPAATLRPDGERLAGALQLWLRADTLSLSDGAAVHVWPDGSGRGRDLTATAGIRKNGSGKPPTFVTRSRVNGRPAVRFEPGCGLAGSPDHLPAIRGDASLTIFLVGRWAPNKSGPPYDNVLMIGNPAAPSNPGKPWSAYLEIDRSSGSLDFAGGWGNDAMLGRGSADLLYRAPRVVSLTKAPGRWTANTKFFFEGRSSVSLLGRALTGNQAVPDIRHRKDIGVSIGKAATFSGNVRGDYAEVIVYNRKLNDAERRGVEQYLSTKYGLLTDAMIAPANVRFTEQEKSHWAFQPVRVSKPPAVADRRWPRTPLDRFVLHKLDSAGLSPAPRADRRTLIRRLSYGLTGLPPAASEIKAFVEDPAPEDVAWNRVVERMLASPRYGERWGRRWLDVVRYADTTANDGNFVMRYAFRYRDYVVDSFNRDRPYDEFLLHQLAGDLLGKSDAQTAAERTIATGFLMVGPKALAETDKEQVRMDIVDEQIDVTGRALLGLTIACARCHDHKFDPIPTVDYYSLAGIFRSTEMFSDLVRNASKWLEYEIPTGDGAKIPVMAARDGAPTHLRVHQRGSRFRLGRLAPRRFLQVLAGEGHAPLTAASSGRLQLARWIADARNPLTARVMVNRIWQGHFGRGLVATSANFGAQGDAPSHPALLDWLARRLVDSGWSVKSMHRLIVHSATWQQAGRTSPQNAARAAQLDPANRLLWRAPRRRLDAEQLRDALLLLSNGLDGRVGGGELVMRLYKEGEILDGKRGVSSASKVNSAWQGFDSPRRSLYLPVVRNGLPDVLALFDAADPNAVTAERNETTVSSQAAFLLNSRFVRQRAAALAASLLREHAEDADRLGAAFERCLGRPPTSADRSDFLSLALDTERALIDAGTDPRQARQTAWQQVCQTIFCLNEFLYTE